MIERRSQERKAIPRSEALLDAAVEYTFPASDPISVDHAFGKARERERKAPVESRSGDKPERR